MGKLPNGHRAIIDYAKIERYLLDPTHRTGRHKARVFASALGLSAVNSHLLEDALRQAAENEDVVRQDDVPHGVQYVIDHVMSVNRRSATIRSTWIILGSEDTPRLVTAYVASPEAKR
jgi:hypothetical protein